VARSNAPDLIRRIVAALVVAGLAISIAAGVFLIDRPAVGDLPGIALGSEAILVVERIVMLFGTWLLTVVVLVRALAGDLPVEISGRGVRSAEVATAQQGLLGSEHAFERVDRELEALHEAMSVIDGKYDELVDLPRRYAMKGDGNGN
jgi:hypothetical protein